MKYTTPDVEVVEVKNDALVIPSAGNSGDDGEEF